MNFLCHCYKFVTTGRLSFSEEEYKHILEVQMEWIHILNALSSREFNPDEIVSCKGVSMCPWVQDKVLKQYSPEYNGYVIGGILLYIPPHSSFCVLMCVANDSLFSSGAQESK